MAAGSLRRSIRQSLTVARRDFIATVFTPTFLIFLLSPLLTIAFGAAGGVGASKMTRSVVDRSKLVVLTAPDRTSGDSRGRRAIARRVRPRRRAAAGRISSCPTANPEAQARTLIGGREGDVDAVLYRPARRAAHPLRQRRGQRSELSRRARRPGVARRPHRIDGAAKQAGEGAGRADAR